MHKIKTVNLDNLKMPLKIVDPLIIRLVKKINESTYNLVDISRDNMI